MAIGSRSDLHAMAALIMAPLPSPFLSEEEAVALEKIGCQVLRIPVASRKES